MTIHDFQAASSNSEAVGSFLRMAGKSLPLNEHVRGTFEWAFPIVFAGLSNDSTLGVGGRIALGLSCMALFCLFLVRAAAELKTAIKDRSWALVRVMAATTFLAGLAFVWLVGGGGQYTRPRYFLPLLCGFALALGDISGALWKRWPLAAVALAGSVIGWNTWSNLDRLRSGLEEGRNLRAFSEKIEGLGLRTGYSGVAVAGPLIMLTGERVSVDGVLGSTVGERLPARHIDRVRLHGPDFYLADQDASDRLTRRFGELGVTYEIARAPGTLVLFHGFSRPVALSEVRE